jgi:hypothetical protein
MTLQSGPCAPLPAAADRRCVPCWTPKSVPSFGDHLPTAERENVELEVVSTAAVGRRLEQAVRCRGTLSGA